MTVSPRRVSYRAVPGSGILGAGGFEGLTTAVAGTSFAPLAWAATRIVRNSIPARANAIQTPAISSFDPCPRKLVSCAIPFPMLLMQNSGRQLRPVVDLGRAALGDGLWARGHARVVRNGGRRYRRGRVAGRRVEDSMGQKVSHREVGAIPECCLSPPEPAARPPGWAFPPPTQSISPLHDFTSRCK